MIKRALFGLALVTVLVVPMQTQAQIVGTYTVSGSSGNWFLEFIFTNNFTGEWLYDIGGRVVPISTTPLNSFDIVTTGATSSWVPTTICGWYGGWSIPVPCSFANVFASGIGTGTTMGGFTATYASILAPSTLILNARVARANPSTQFERRFVATRVSVPEPSSMMLIAMGLFGLVGVGVRRRRQDLNEEV